MDRNELTLAIAGALVAAFLAGWVLHWIFSRLNRPAGPRNSRRTADMAARMHAAEEAQHAAEAKLREVEGDLRHRVAELQSELDATQETLERERSQGEELRAAYRAAMTERESPAS